MKIISRTGNSGFTHQLASFFFCVYKVKYCINQKIPTTLHLDENAYKHFLNVFDINLDFFDKTPFKDTGDSMLCCGTDHSINSSTRHNDIDWTKHLNDTLIFDSCFVSKYELQDFLDILVLKPHIKQHIQKLYLKINEGNYFSIHVRGADRIKLNYSSSEEFYKFQEERVNCIIKSHPSTVFLLCSDNQRMLKQFVDNKQIFSESFLYKTTNLIPEESKIHSYDTESKFLETIYDFYLLLLSKKIFFDTKSGFSQTVNFLHTQINNNNIYNYFKRQQI